MLYKVIKPLLIILLGFGWLNLYAQDLQTTDSLKIVIKVTKEPREKVDALIQLAELLKDNHKENALPFAQTALEISKENNYYKGVQISTRIQAELYRRMSDFNKAVELAIQSQVMAEEQKNETEKAFSIQILGLIYSDLGDYNRSSQLLFESLRIFEDTKNKKGISQTYNGIGSVYFRQDNYDKALEYFSKALFISRELNDNLGIGRGLNNLAVIYKRQEDYRLVKKYLHEAIIINKKEGHITWEGINYLNMGDLFEIQNNLDSAYYFFNLAADIFDESNNLRILAKTYIAISNYYININNLDKSLEYSHLAFSIGKENNLLNTQMLAANQLHSVYKELDDLNNAYRYISLQYKLKDSLEIEKSVTQISQLELLYELEKTNKQKKIEQQKKEYTHNITIISIVFVLLMTIVILLARHRIKLKNALIEKRQLKNEIEMRSKELTFNVMSLMKKNEVLSEIANKLMGIRNEAVRDETKSAIKRIANELQKTSDSEVWDEFELRFKQVHGEFYDKLISSFPDLSPNEQKLCAFLRLNMSTKEISGLTGQQASTIDVARTRLRKKLRITNTSTNLVTFLSQI